MSIFPELVFSEDFNEVLPLIQSELKKQNIESKILFGAYFVTDEGRSNAIIDSSSMKPVYHKQKLVPLFEFLPEISSADVWQSSWLPQIDKNQLITPNHSSKTINLSNSFSILPMICSEALYGYLFTNLYKPYGVIIHFSDMGWSQSFAVKHYFTNLLKIRALEHQKPLLSVSNNSSSLYINHRGELINSLVKRNSFWLQTVTPRTGLTPYAKHGNQWLIYILIVFIFMQFSFKLYRLNPTQSNSI